MVNKTLCNVIAYLSAIFSGIASVWVIFVLIVGLATMNDPPEEGEGPEDQITGTDMAFYSVNVVVTVAIFVASVFLIIGIKRDRHKFVAPWVYIIAIGVVVSIIGLIVDHNEWLSEVIAIVIQIAFWYPIFAIYRELRKAPANQNVAYNACPTNVPGGGGYGYPQSNVYNTQAQPVYPNLTNYQQKQ
ncbi:uncharacterized protein LOC142241011 [Haematobia irritans]|uniref:uncharacterized protein LOC142241011 n=1 Tax=Haematobia irritans TaxID=7368 RepID=UPI003F4F600B